MRKAEIDRHFPDVNVLLAMAWPNHQFHGTARRWFEEEGRVTGWSTCAVTQLGFVRLSSNPAFTPAAVRPPEAVALLQKLCHESNHTFVEASDLTLFQEFSYLLGHKQVTDAYLVGLARATGHRMVSFDKRLAKLCQSEFLYLLSSEPL